MAKILFTTLISVVIVVSTYSCYTPVKKKELSLTLNSNILHLAWQNEYYLWAMEAPQYQLTRWDTQSNSFLTFKDVGGKLFVDLENTLWVFDKKVINRFNGQTFDTFHSETDFVGGPLFAVEEDARYIWLGTYGLSRYDKQSKVWEIVWDTLPTKHIIDKPKQTSQMAEILAEGVHSIASTKQGQVWVGTNGGLVKLDDEHQQIWTSGSISKGVRCLIYTYDNTLWVCSANGIGKWEDNHIVNTRRIDEPYLLMEGNQGDIWAANREAGIIRWNGTFLDEWKSQERVIGLRPTALLESNLDNTIWISTKMGISHWDGNHWQNYSTEDGLTSNHINTLLQDPTGVLWAATQNGINRYSSETDRWELFPAD